MVEKRRGENHRSIPENHQDGVVSNSLSAGFPNWCFPPLKEGLGRHYESVL